MSSKREVGGPAAQAGIYFQNCITTLRLAEMLCQEQLPPISSGRIMSVRTEAPEEVDDTVVTWSGGRKEYIQAKCATSLTGKAWNKLWHHFYQQYDSSDFNKALDGDIITLAVSWTAPMVDLESLLIIARAAHTEEEWISRLNKPQKELLENVKAILDIGDEPLFQFCRFVQVWVLAFEGDPMGTDTFEREVSRKLRGVVEPTTNVFSVLMDLVGRKARVRGTWEYNDLVTHLEQKNFQLVASTTPISPSEFQLLDPNPYQVGPPLRSPNDLFVGRDVLVNKIMWRLDKHYKDKMAPNAVLLYGPHRSGKTSVLFRLIHKVGPDFRSVYVDLNTISLAAQSPDVLQAIATQMETSLLGYGIAVGVPNHSEFVSEPVRAMTTFIRGIVSACAPQKPILMLDESDTLSRFADDLETTRSLLVFLRSLVEQNRDVFFIFASCRDIRWLADPGMSRLLTLADEYFRVDLLSDSETRTLILDPVKEYFIYEPVALVHIINLSGRHPCFVQAICKHAVEWRNQHQVNQVSSKALLSDIIPDAVAQEHLQFHNLWNGFTQDEQVVLYALSYTLGDEDTTTSDVVQAQLATLQLHVADWNIALDRLRHAGLIDVQEGHLSMKLGLLKYWIHRNSVNTLFRRHGIYGAMGGMN
jgi:hypothetical protein